MVGEKVQGRANDAMTNVRRLVDDVLNRIRTGGKDVIEIGTDATTRFATANRRLIGR